MSGNSIGMALACLVSGALGAFGVSLLSRPAEAREGATIGNPHVVNVTVGQFSVPLLGDASTPASGVVWRLWSDGTLDAVAYHAKPPASGLSTGWNGLCDATGVPPSICFELLGVVPDDPASPADVNGDGTVDAADLGRVLSHWGGLAAAR